MVRWRARQARTGTPAGGAYCWSSVSSLPGLRPRSRRARRPLRGGWRRQSRWTCGITASPSSPSSALAAPSPPRSTIRATHPPSAEQRRGSDALRARWIGRRNPSPVPSRGSPHSRPCTFSHSTSPTRSTTSGVPTRAARNAGRPDSAPRWLTRSSTAGTKGRTRACSLPHADPPNARHHSSLRRSPSILSLSGQDARRPRADPARSRTAPSAKPTARFRIIIRYRTRARWAPCRLSSATTRPRDRNRQAGSREDARQREWHLRHGSSRRSSQLIIRTSSRST
jgi:hypothetical protein